MNIEESVGLVGGVWCALDVVGVWVLCMYVTFFSILNNLYIT